AAAPAPPAAAPAPVAERSPLDSALDTAAQAADSFTLGLPSLDAAKGKTQNPQAGAGAAGTAGMADEATAEAAGAVRYSVLPPMGYAVQTEPARGQNAPPMMRYVRTMHTEGPGTTTAPADGPASQAARAAQDRREPVPYFTLPENATLAGATAMTALIGRVPIDGRVTDPMQFKAVIGRDNLAANGFELPGDVSGMIVTGVAIGDMALSCSEGRVRSVTFVFNDGSIQTVSARGAGSRSINTGAGASSNSDLGFISDLHGNPCITGKFVTNAPAYLTDLIGLGALGVAGQAYSEAQRTTYSGMQGSSSTITGSAGSYALGQAVAGGTNEVSKWLLQRLKNSFDAVITPSGHQLVVHLDREIQIDKAPNARKLIHRKQGGLQLARGEHHGLE
ncbi:MAG TPA: TIGR03752 family integrating conjugative element protein, partial [Acidovorax temperans]|nr:TIGR03752 family integrating conjugative element protein [Acidovorax temperans]